MQKTKDQTLKYFSFIDQMNYFEELMQCIHKKINQSFKNYLIDNEEFDNLKIYLNIIIRPKLIPIDCIENLDNIESKSNDLNILFLCIKNIHQMQNKYLIQSELRNRRKTRF